MAREGFGVRIPRSWWDGIDDGSTPIDSSVLPTDPVVVSGGVTSPSAPQIPPLPTTPAAGSNPLGIGSYTNLLNGFDWGKLNNPDKQTYKYQAARILSNYAATPDGLIAASKDPRFAAAGFSLAGLDKIRTPEGEVVDVGLGFKDGGRGWWWGSDGTGGFTGQPAKTPATGNASDPYAGLFAGLSSILSGLGRPGGSGATRATYAPDASSAASNSTSSYASGVPWGRRGFGPTTLAASVSPAGGVEPDESSAVARYPRRVAGGFWR